MKEDVPKRQHQEIEIFKHPNKNKIKIIFLNKFQISKSKTLAFKVQ